MSRGISDMKKTLVTVGVVIGVAVMAFAQSKRSDLDRLVEYMTGSFSTAEQALKDPAFYDIRLVMAPIWKARSDGRWLYVEQASASRMNKPYRQRVYHVTKVNDTTFRCDVYDIEGRERFAGKWSDTNFMMQLPPDSLISRDGCEIILYKVNDTLFEGGTSGDGCRTNYRDAHFRTSEVRVTPSMFYRWDRGYGEDNSQMWGATEGGYEFRREGGR